ncbi:MAG TPA: SAM-dependent chlorinase/fluorinase [Gemmataceae bacterium]|nr:SAM-dependent chlorinase/fluorinase [Gemmataceae bacterium]
MPDPIITLTTDFGVAAPYAAALKGVILALNPAARLVDLTHQVPPQDVFHAAFFLANAVPCFPREAIHVVVVDPGVGSDRALLYVEVGGRRLLAPDNGCWTLIEGGGEPRVIRLAERRFWREPVSSTFHGRDILAPVAAHLSLGIDPTLLGPPAREWVRLARHEPRPVMNGLTGEVVFIDDFGNIITNIRADWAQAPGVLLVGGVTLTESFRWVRTYADASPGSLVALTSSNGLLEIAVAQGNAARRLGAEVGTPVTIGWAK